MRTAESNTINVIPQGITISMCMIFTALLVVKLLGVSTYVLPWAIVFLPLYITPAAFLLFLGSIAIVTGIGNSISKVKPSKSKPELHIL